MQSRRQRFHREPLWRVVWRRLTATAAGITLPVVVLAVVALGLPGTWLLLPPPHLPADTLVYDPQGQLLTYLYSTENRIPVPGSHIPPVMQNALVAIEDDRFWLEPGIDPVGILRAALTDVAARRIVQGGSTLTQQLAKNLYLSDRRTFSRKIKELFITLKLGSIYTKTEIIHAYLNDVYFGQGAYGIGAASRVYFGHGARSLTLPEAALLAGLVTAPSYYDPYLHPGAAMARRNLVLQRMAALHYITPAAARRAEAAPLGLAPSSLPDWATLAPYYFQYVTHQIQRIDPAVGQTLYTGGYRITVSLSPQAQLAADRAMANDMPPATLVSGVPEPEGAIVGINPQNGNIEALVGGRNYAVSTFDRATRAFRQPGSTFKYFLYTTAIAEGYSTSAVKVSAPVRFPNGHGGWYVPHNFGHVYNGPLTMRRAIAISDDIVALKWMDQLGPPAVIRMAHQMGITSPLADNLTTALGSSSVSPLEMARALSTLANGGYRVVPRAVLQIAASNGHILYQAPVQRTRVLSPQVTYVVDQLFTAPLVSPVGTAHDLTSIFWRPGDAKTGTSSAQRDAWLAGFTPQLVGVVWVGNDNDTPINLTGDLGAGPVWAHFMVNALAGQPVVTFRQPPGVVWRTVCEGTGLLGSAACCNAYREVFIRGRQPRRLSPSCGGGGGTSGAARVRPVPLKRPASPPPSFLDRILRTLEGV
jgi:1A family penicillin-binding protein